MSNLVPFSNYVEVNPARYIPDGLKLTSKVSFVPMADVSESGHWFGSQVRRLNEVATCFTNFKNNDVLVAKITPCFENGKGAFAADLENGVGFGSTEFHVLRAKQGTCARFIFHVTQWPQFRLSSERFMTGSAGQKRVQALAFNQFEIGDFGEEEQTDIANILDTLDTQIRQTEAIIGKLQQVKQGLLHDLLTRGIDENGQLRPPYELAPELYKESPLGWIPKDWEVSTVGKQFQIQLGKMLDSEKNTGTFKPYIGNKAVRWNHIDTSEIQDIRMSQNDLNRFRLQEGDILVCEGGEVGRAAVWDAPIEECYYQKALHRLRPVNGFNPHLLVDFLFYAIKKDYLSEYISKTSIAHLTKEKLAQVPLPVPNKREQDKIIKELAAHKMRLKNETLKLDKLNKQKAGLMDDLLTGRVRVTELIKQDKQAS
ncbi:restriction endonuclease subunit S [Halomonas sp. 18H]|nr:restriction endonuclease subunit S [Halomonas sp. 18H]MCW4150863.1 restriction endonuclease subunit S [Halomonas sp. 18H]